MLYRNDGGNKNNYLSVRLRGKASALGAGMCAPGDVPALARSIRFQLAERRLLTPPTDMGWAAIAASALDAIRRVGGAGA